MPKPSEVQVEKSEIEDKVNEATIPYTPPASDNLPGPGFQEPAEEENN